MGTAISATVSQVDGLINETREIAEVVHVTAPLPPSTPDSPPGAAPAPPPARNVLADGQDLAQTGKIEYVDFHDLYRADNVRTPITEQIPRMVESLLRNGFKQNHPLVLSAKPDGRFLVLCGNRRTMGLEFLAENDAAAFAKILPGGKVPAIVHHDLTAEQEAILRIDHGTDEDRVPLDEYGLFLAIRQLVRAGYDTQAGIAEKLGKFKLDKKSGKSVPNREWVQPRVNLAQLPQFVQDEFRKLWADGQDATNVRTGMIAKLYKTFTEEYRNFPDGNGPQFSALWAECLGKTPAARTPKAAVITPSAALEKSKLVGSRNLREALRVVAGSAADGVTLADVDAALIAAEAAQTTLVEIAEYMGETDFAELIAAAREHAEAKAASDAAIKAAAQATATTAADIAESEETETETA
jgi:hypothetical protein